MRYMFSIIVIILMFCFIIGCEKTTPIKQPIEKIFMGIKQEYTVTINKGEYFEIKRYYGANNGTKIFYDVPLEETKWISLGSYGNAFIFEIHLHSEADLNGG